MTLSPSSISSPNRINQDFGGGPAHPVPSRGTLASGRSAPPVRPPIQHGCPPDDTGVQCVSGAAPRTVLNINTVFIKADGAWPTLLSPWQHDKNSESDYEAIRRSSNTGGDSKQNNPPKKREGKPGAFSWDRSAVYIYARHNVIATCRGQ